MITDNIIKWRDIILNLDQKINNGKIWPTYKDVKLILEMNIGYFKIRNRHQSLKNWNNFWKDIIICIILSKERYHIFYINALWSSLKLQWIVSGNLKYLYIILVHKDRKFHEVLSMFILIYHFSWNLMGFYLLLRHP